MATKVSITRSGIKCADPNCGVELKVGSEALLYHGRNGRLYYGLGCHEKKKMSQEEYLASKKKTMEMLKKKDTEELNTLIQRQDLTTREECIDLLRKEQQQTLEPEEKELLERIRQSIEKAQNKRLWKYSWKQLLEEAAQETPTE